MTGDPTEAPLHVRCPLCHAAPGLLCASLGSGRALGEYHTVRILLHAAQALRTQGRRDDPPTAGNR